MVLCYRPYIRYLFKKSLHKIIIRLIIRFLLITWEALLHGLGEDDTVSLQLNAQLALFIYQTLVILVHLIKRFPYYPHHH